MTQHYIQCVWLLLDLPTCTKAIPCNCLYNTLGLTTSLVPRLHPLSALRKLEVGAWGRGYLTTSYDIDVDILPLCNQCASDTLNFCTTSFCVYVARDQQAPLYWKSQPTRRECWFELDQIPSTCVCVCA